MLVATYKDGKAKEWQTAFMTVDELSKDFWRHAKHLQQEDEVGNWVGREEEVYVLSSDNLVLSSTGQGTIRPLEELLKLTGKPIIFCLCQLHTMF